MTVSDSNLLIVHRGAAHRDDLLSASVLLARRPEMTVERRDPTEAELDDPKVLVADVGLRHQPERNNFDHHQFPADDDPCCALTLILRAMDMEPLARELWPWLGLTEIVDSRGPNAAASSYGITPEVLRDTLSPVERWLLREFAMVKRTAPGGVLHERLRALGQWLLDDLEATGQRLGELERVAMPLKIQGIEVLDLRDIEKDPLCAIEIYCKRSAPNTAMVVARNKCGPGWTLWRRNDHPCVDFRRLKGKRGVSFVHATGFMAVLEPDVDPLLLAEAGIVITDRSSPE